MHQVFIVEQDPVIDQQLRRLLAELDCASVSVTSIEQARQELSDDFCLIISELEIGEALGTELLKHAPNTPVLMMSGYTRLPSSIDSLHHGAVDFISKPFSDEEMKTAIRQAINSRPATSTSHAAAENSAEYFPPVEGMIGRSTAMQQVYKRISKSAPTQSTVLIRGETGTGKELVAKAIHAASDRSNEPFVAVNCAAIPETLIESELFGHEKGAFTGAANKRAGLIEAAEGGTLFLDEIGELPPEAQARLLRFIQESEIRRIGSNDSHPVNVRLVAATHRDLKTLCHSGAFRQDLYYRINVVRIDLPPLKQRGADLLELTEYLLAQAAIRHDKPGLRLTPDAVQALTSYNWPGNVRELENVVERAAIMCENIDIDAKTLEIDVDMIPTQRIAAETLAPLSVTDNLRQSTSSAHSTIEPNEDLSLEDYFQRFVLENQDQMNETELAKKLGISRKCLWERRQRLGIPRLKSNNNRTVKRGR